MEFDNFYEEVSGVSEPTPPAAPVAPAPTPTPASEGVTTPPDKEQFVPFSRFKEVNDSLKETRETQTQTQAELTRIKEALGGISRPAADDTPSLDPEAQKALEAYLGQQGFVKKADLEKETAAQRAQSDLAELKTTHKLSDDDLDKVRAQAVKMGAANRDGLEAAYKTLFFDQLVEDRIKEALSNVGRPGTSAEVPGKGTPPAPGKSTGPMSLKDRIKLARTNAT